MKITFYVGILWASIVLVSCQLIVIEKPISQQEIERIILRYPHAKNFSRTESRNKSAALVITYTYETIDSKQTVADYYEKILSPYGFQRIDGATAQNVDIYLWHGGCPVYAVTIKTNTSTHVVEAVTTLSMCV